jgi:hypothetical protein
MVCPLCGANHAVCRGRADNKYVPVGWGQYGPETGPPTGRYPRARLYEEIPMGMYTATERLYLDADGKVVKADDPARRSLLINTGQTMPEEQARELGLIEDEAKAADRPTETKARSRAPENK